MLNQDEVDPLFGQVDATLSQETVDLSAQVERAQRWGDIGVLVTVLLSRRAVTAVQGRRRRLEVRHQTRQQSEARYRTLIDKSSDLVLVLGRDGEVSFASPAAERLLVSGDEEGSAQRGQSSRHLTGRLHPDRLPGRRSAPGPPA